MKMQFYLIFFFVFIPLRLYGESLSNLQTLATEDINTQKTEYDISFGFNLGDSPSTTKFSTNSKLNIQNRNFISNTRFDLDILHSSEEKKSNTTISIFSNTKFQSKKNSYFLIYSRDFFARADDENENDIIFMFGPGVRIKNKIYADFSFGYRFLDNYEGGAIRPALSYKSAFNLASIKDVKYTLEAAYIMVPDISSLGQFNINFTKNISDRIDCNLFLNYELGNNKQEKIRNIRRKIAFSIDVNF